VKILLIGHGCSPYRGSEPGLTWNWAWHLSQHHDIWLLAHPEFKSEVDAFLANQPNPRVHFHWVALKGCPSPWIPRLGKLGFKLHFSIWQRKLFQSARRLQQELAFDLVHQVSLGTISFPPSLWKLGPPFVWGPLGGGQTPPQAFRRYFGSSWKWEQLRALRIKLLPLWPRFRKTVRHCRLLLSTNQETTGLLESAGARQAHFFLDNGISQSYFDTAVKSQRKQTNETVFLWAGSLESIKALPLVLEALSRVPHQIPIRFWVAGEGSRRQDWVALSKRLGLDNRVSFLGQVPWTSMKELMMNSDVFVFSSLRDSSGSVVLEAMACQLPIIALDHQGIGQFISSQAGMKIPVTTPVETVDSMAQAMTTLAQSPELRQKMGQAAYQLVQTELWDNRAKRMCQLYDEIIEETPQTTR
jgi:glycosyltransferase involved in cell wall biosynthesis